MTTGGRLNARNTLNLLMGDAGDTLNTARVTNIAGPGDRFTLPSTSIGDGPRGNLDVDLHRINATAGSTLTARSFAAARGCGHGHGAATLRRLGQSARVER